MISFRLFIYIFKIADKMADIKNSAIKASKYLSFVFSVVTVLFLLLFFRQSFLTS